MVQNIYQSLQLINPIYSNMNVNAQKRHDILYLCVVYLYVIPLLFYQTDITYSELVPY
jgi:hypothetical protein